MGGARHQLRHYGDGAAIGSIFLLALAVRGVFAARLAVIFNDGPTFIALARHMEGGEWAQALSHQFHPFYSLLIAGAHALVDDWERPAVAISIAAGSAAVVAFYLFLRDAFDAEVAWIGALLLALLPYAVRFSADVQSDGLYLWLFLSGVACLWRAWRDERAVWAAAAGLFSGLAYLTRPEGVGVAAVGVALAGAACLLGRWSVPAAARWVAALGVGAAVPMAPYLLAMRQLSGAWTLTRKKSISQLAGLDLEVAASSAGLAWIGLAIIVGAGVTAVVLVARRRWRRPVAPVTRRGVALAAAASAALVAGLILLRPSLGPHLYEFAQAVISTLRPEIALLVVIGGLAALWRSPSRRRGLFIAAFFALYGPVLFGLLVNVGYLDRRHVLPPLVLLLGYAAAGVPVVAEALQRRAARWIPRSAALSHASWLAIAILGLVVLVLPKIFHDRRVDALAERRAGEWLRARPELSGSVAAARIRTAYYAGEDWVLLPEANAVGNLEAAARRGARYAIVDAMALGTDDGSPVTFRVLHREEIEGYSAVILELAEPRGKSP